MIVSSPLILWLVSPSASFEIALGADDRVGIRPYALLGWDSDVAARSEDAEVRVVGLVAMVVCSSTVGFVNFVLS